MKLSVSIPLQYQLSAGAQKLRLLLSEPSQNQLAYTSKEKAVDDVNT